MIVAKNPRNSLKGKALKGRSVLSSAGNLRVIWPFLQAQMHKQSIRVFLPRQQPSYEGLWDLISNSLDLGYINISTLSEWIISDYRTITRGKSPESLLTDRQLLR